VGHCDRDSLTLFVTKFARRLPLHNLHGVPPVKVAPNQIGDKNAVSVVVQQTERVTLLPGYTVKRVESYQSEPLVVRPSFQHHFGEVCFEAVDGERVLLYSPQQGRQAVGTFARPFSDPPEATRDVSHSPDQRNGENEAGHGDSRHEYYDQSYVSRNNTVEFCQWSSLSGFGGAGRDRNTTDPDL